MIITRFWGVRGSVPAPGPHTVQVGGNTSCVEVRCGEVRLVFDGGTGLRLLGKEIVGESPLTLHLFFSHVHWDHIQGFPFFAPAFVPGNTIHLYGAANVYGTIEAAMAGQMEFPNFPVKLSQLPSTLVFHDLSDSDEVTVADGVRVRTAPGNHPGGVLAYRVESGGHAVVYATDTEHFEDRIDGGLVELARGADALIYDSQYTPEEYRGEPAPAKIGWGHSTFVAGARVAREAGVKQYVLFHHDPDQDDAAVRDKERRARELFEPSIAAYEGLELRLG
ncbi:MAG: MBL fold metallo-hydrolase [Myxococcota bacterium]